MLQLQSFHQQKKCDLAEFVPIEGLFQSGENIRSNQWHPNKLSHHTVHTFNAHTVKVFNRATEFDNNNNNRLKRLIVCCMQKCALVMLCVYKTAGVR